MPFFVQYVNTLGACPRIASPYRMRDAENRNEFPAENADVNTHALITDGSTLIPARVNAITYGDSAAVPESFSRLLSLYGTSMPVIKIPRICAFQGERLATPDNTEMTYVEHEDTPEDAANGLGNVTTGALSLRRSTVYAISD